VTGRPKPASSRPGRSRRPVVTGRSGWRR